MIRHTWQRKFLKEDEMQYTALVGYTCEHCGVEVLSKDFWQFEKDQKQRTRLSAEEDRMRLVLDVLVDTPGRPLSYCEP